MWAMAKKPFYGWLDLQEKEVQKNGTKDTLWKNVIQSSPKHPIYLNGMVGIAVWSVKQPKSACCRQDLYLILSYSC